MPTWRKLHTKIALSLDVDAMPDDFTRLLWLLLPIGLDREGRGLDHPAWVKAVTMPLRHDVPPEQIAAALDWFAARGLIERYQVDGQAYFWAPSFKKYQGINTREKDSEIPPPPGDGRASGADEKPAAGPQPATGKETGEPLGSPMQDAGSPHESRVQESRDLHDSRVQDSGNPHDSCMSTACPDVDVDSDADADADSNKPKQPSDSPAREKGGGGRRSRRSKSPPIIRPDPIQDPLAEAWEQASGLPVGNPQHAVRALDEMHAAGVLPEDIAAAVRELNAKGKNRWTGIASIVRPAKLARDARLARASPGSPRPSARTGPVDLALAELDANTRADLQFVRYNPHAPGADEVRRRLLARGVRLDPPGTPAGERSSPR